MSRTERTGSMHRERVAVAARRPVLTAAAVALGARLAVAVIRRLAADPLPDEAEYTGLVDAAIAGRGSTGPFRFREDELWQQVRTFTEPHLALARAIGDTRFAGQLIAVAFGVAAVAATAALARRWFGDRAALLAGLLVALWPSQVLFSSAALKDSAVWAVSAAALLIVDHGTAATATRRWRWLVAFVACLVLLDGLRDQTFAVVTYAGALGVAVAPALDLRRRVAAAAVLVVAVPALLGHGPASSHELDRAGGLGSTRYAGNQGSETAIGGVRFETIPPRLPPTGPGGPTSTSVPTGFAIRIDDSTGANVAHLPRGLLAVLLRPLPWESSADTGHRMARIESVPWFGLLGAALAGLWRQRRRWRRLAAPVALAGGMVVVYALTEGNVGTAFRHRGEVVWVAAVLAAGLLARPPSPASAS